MIAVAAGVLSVGGKYFLAKRKGGDYSGCWEMPGGKYEKGESWDEAIKREWVEELDCEIQPGFQFFRETFSNAKVGKFTVVAGYVHLIGGLLPQVGRVHSESAWMTLGEAIQLTEVVPSTLPILRTILDLAIQQPSRAERDYIADLRQRVAFVPKGQHMDVSQEEYDACVASFGEQGLSVLHLAFHGRPLKVVR